MKFIEIPHGKQANLEGLSSIIQLNCNFDDLAVRFGPIRNVKSKDLYIHLSGFKIVALYNTLTPTMLRLKNEIASKIELKAYGDVILAKYNIDKSDYVDFSLQEFQFFFNKFDKRFLLDEKFVGQYELEYSEFVAGDDDVDDDDMMRPRKRKRI